MYRYSCCNVKGRGCLYASNYVRYALKDVKNTKYCLKIDIKSYFASIDHDILKNKLRHRIKDKDVIWLCDTIIDSYKDGLPLGNYSSQWFANFFLENIDRYIKQELKIPYYVRYMDDMVLFSGNKRALHKARIKLFHKLNQDGLQVKGNWQVFLVAYNHKGKLRGRFVDFVGFKHYRGFTTIRKGIYKRLRRNVLRFKPTLKRARSLISYNGYVIYSDNSLHIKEFKKARYIIHEESKNTRNERA